MSILAKKYAKKFQMQRIMNDLNSNTFFKNDNRLFSKTIHSINSFKLIWKHFNNHQKSPINYILAKYSTLLFYLHREFLFQYLIVLCNS